MQCTVVKADDSEIEIEHINIVCGYNAVFFVNKTRSVRSCDDDDDVRSEDCFFYWFNSVLYGEPNVGESVPP
jgi:hypothetical protein